MNGEYVALSDRRVNMKSSHPGKVYTLDAPNERDEFDLPVFKTDEEKFPTRPPQKTGPSPAIARFTWHANGLHQEPRMTSVMAPISTWQFDPGDFAEIEVEDVPLLGIAVELADHHWDMDLYIDGEKVYGEFYCVSSYLPTNDGYGRIHWIMLNRAKHKVRVQISEKYNRMLDLSNVKPHHTCLNGFVLMNDLVFPPPSYGTWMYSQEAVEGWTANGSLKNNIIPAKGHLFLMDLYGQGTLETLTFHVDYPVALELIDGGVAEPAFQRDFPAWMRRVDLAGRGGALATVERVRRPDDGYLGVAMTKPAKFGSRLIVRLFNPDGEDHRIEGMYMEGTLRCM